MTAGRADDVLFCINGTEHRVKRDSEHVKDTLNDYIRRRTPYKGTKLACGEGGCGSCAVEIVRHDPETGQESFTAINSCLCPVGSVDGTSITTVEGIGNSKAGYHAVQEAYGRHYALQCGACTPGFVTSTHAAIKKCHMQGKKPTVEQVQQGLDGNLCRCTGYRPILDACRSLVKHPDVEDLCQTVSACKSGGFPESLKNHLETRAAQRSQAGSWSAPTSLDALLCQLDACTGSVRLVAGNTGYGIYKEWLSEDHLLDVKQVPELRRLSLTKSGLEVGGAVTIEELILALQGSKGPTPEAYQGAAQHLLRIAGNLVRAAATIGGNLVLTRERALQSNLVPMLIVLGARCTVRSLHSKKCLPVLELLYGAPDLDIGGKMVVEAVHIPMPPKRMYVWGHKLAKRYYNAHALVDLSVSARLGQTVSNGLSASAQGIEDVCIVISMPTVIEKGVAGLQCGPDKVEWRSVRAAGAEAALKALSVDALVTAMEELQHDINPSDTPDGGTEYFYRSAAEGLLLQAFAPLLADTAALPPKMQRLLASAQKLAEPGVAVGKQTYPDYSGIAAPAHENVEKDRVHLMTSGEALYTSDIGLGGSGLHAVPVLSSQALARLEHVDPSKALKVPGVVDWVSAKDVPGENKVKGGASDSPVFAEGKVEHVGQVIGLVVADSPRAAQEGAAKVAVRYGHPKELGEPVITIPAAIQAKSYYNPPGNDSHETLIRLGDADRVIAESPLTIKAARYSLPSQQHMYMETQCAVADPEEDGGMVIHSSTQTLDGIQSAVARALGIPCHAVTATCRRLGGAFGGKVARSMPVAAAAAVAAAKTGRRVRYSLSRNDDMRINGGRSETMVEYDVGLKPTGEITALKIQGYFLCGAFLDLGFNDMMVLQQGVDQAYDFKHMSLDLYIVRTNLNPRTIMRSPGFINSVMIIEQIMEHVAEVSGVDPVEVRRLNFLKTYPMAANPQMYPSAAPLPCSSRTSQAVEPVQRKQHGCGRLHQWPTPGPALMSTSLGRMFEAELYTLPRIWDELLKDCGYYKRCDDIKAFNQEHAWRKRGISITPCRFDAAPPPINASVSIYHDGSVLIVSGGQEMGQGLHTKLKQIASYELGKLLPEDQRPLPLDLMRIGDSRSDVVPNGGPSWSSTTSEAAVAAVSEACKQLVKNLASHTQEGEHAEDTWRSTIATVHADVGYAPAMAMLSAYGFFDGKTRDDPGGRTPAVSGVKAAESLAYCTFGAACTEVELDMLTGEQRVLRSDILFDCGRSINPALDMGQVEGAFIQGLGLFTSEEVITDENTGRLITDGTWEYKIPAATCIPRQFNATFLKDSPNRRGVMGSKASGEPSLLLSVSILHALRAAVKAARQEVMPHAAHCPGLISAAAEGSCMEGNAADGGGRREDFVALPGPASIIRLKEACGPFSVARILRAALDEEDLSQVMDGWMHVHC